MVKIRSRKRNPYQRHVHACLKEGMSLKEARKSWKQMKRSVGKKSRGRKSSGRKSRGRKSRGRKSSGRKSRGRKSSGRKSRGRKSRGRKSPARKRSKRSGKSSTRKRSKRSARKRPKRSKKSGTKLKRNYRLHSRVSPNDDNFSKSAIDYFKKREIEHAKVMNILSKRSTNIKKLLWVRHCESCSNVSSIFSKNKYDEPLCTRKGISQALAAGEGISFILPENIGSTIFSSFLPRAIETALLVAISFNRNNYLKYKNMEGLKVKAKKKVITTLKIIDNISEHLQLTDTNPLRKNKLSQSKTSYNSANTYITKIIDLIKNNDEYKEYVPSIEWNSENCTKAKQCNLCHSKEKDDIQSFLSSNFNIFENNKMNIIVSHGGFIRKKICKNLKKFGNCEAGLTELNRDGTLTECVNVLDKNDVIPRPKYLDPSNPLYNKDRHEKWGQPRLYVDLNKYGDCTFDRVKLSTCKLNR